jgi:hypothetical protein
LINRFLRLAPFCSPAILLALWLIAACAPAPTFRDPAPLDVSRDPEQCDIEDPRPFSINGGSYAFRIFPLASYDLRGILLGRESYGGDIASAISPCDVSAAWGEMARDDLCGQLRWSQSGRWYWWEYGPGFGHDNAFVARYTSNTHVIPASGFLAKAVRSARRGDLVELRGELVRVEGRGAIASFRWTSSLSRCDREAGSCEILYLRWLRVGDRVYH